MIKTISGIACLVIGFIVLQIIILIVDIYQVQKLNKFIPNKGLSIDKYHELKWRFNLFISIASVLSITLGYLGFEMKKSLNEQLIEYEELSKSYKELSTSVEKFQGLEGQGKTIEKKLNKFDKRLTSIQKENLGKSEVYSFYGVKLNLYKGHKVDTIAFSNLKTFKNAFTNAFTKIPIINLIQYKGDGFNPIWEAVKIKKVTNNFVILEWESDIPGSIRNAPKTIDFWMIVDK